MTSLAKTPYYSASRPGRRFRKTEGRRALPGSLLTEMGFAPIMGRLRLARLRLSAGTLTIEEWQEIR